MSIKVKLVIIVLCLMISIFALYSFIFVIDVTAAWRITLIVIAVCWIVSGTAALAECLRKK